MRLLRKLNFKPARFRLGKDEAIRRETSHRKCWQYQRQSVEFLAEHLRGRPDVAIVR